MLDQKSGQWEAGTPHPTCIQRFPYSIPRAGNVCLGRQQEAESRAYCGILSIRLRSCSKNDLRTLPCSLPIKYTLERYPGQVLHFYFFFFIIFLLLMPELQGKPLLTRILGERLLDFTRFHCTVQLIIITFIILHLVAENAPAHFVFSPVNRRSVLSAASVLPDDP